MQLADLEKLADSLQRSKSVSVVEGRVHALEGRLDGAQQKLDGIGLSRQFLLESEGRAHSLQQMLEDLFSRIEGKAGTVNALSEDLAHARALRAEWQADALQAEERQREIRGALDRQESQLAELGGVWRNLDVMRDEAESRQETLSVAAKRFDKLQEAVIEADNHMEQVQKRHKNVERVGRELDKLLQQTHALDNRISAIDSKRSSLYEAEFKIGNLQNLMHDIEARVENFKGQKAVIDHVS